MRQPVNFQLLKNIGISIGLLTYLGNANGNEGRDYPNLVILMNADGTGYYAYLYPGVCEREVEREIIADLESALGCYGIAYKAMGIIHSGGMKAYEYEIEA